MYHSILQNREKYTFMSYCFIITISTAQYIENRSHNVICFHQLGECQQNGCKWEMSAKIAANEKIYRNKSRASTEKFPGGGGGATEETKPKNRIINPLSTFCTNYENPLGDTDTPHPHCCPRPCNK